MGIFDFFKKNKVKTFEITNDDFKKLDDKELFLDKDKNPFSGLMIINTPTNPIRIAPHRRQPTCSPKKIAANIVTVSGRDCNIAVTFANGILDSAVKKAIVAPNSAKARMRTIFQFRRSILTKRLLRK